jgi:DtxR family Mn-dependent transcriptional regulator
MTPNKEDYLKAIYKLGGLEKLVSNKQIAETLQVAPASVTEMLGKLGREGLIRYELYKGSRLTDEGMRSAISLVRGHRLWEVFLMRHLGYSWSEAHEDAEHLEHITPPRLMARLDQFLNYPAYCPHGSAIPHPDGQIDLVPMQTLNLLPVGVISHIRRVTEEKELLDYLQETGIAIGSSVRIIKAASYEGPLTLDLEGRHVQISYKAACQIYVDQTEGL